MKQMSTLGWIAFILVIIGGLNWGLVSVGYNVVDSIFGVGSMISAIVYGLVGLSALYLIVAAAMKPKGSQM